MSNFKTNIDKLVARILEEEIQTKTSLISEKMEKKLTTKQKFIAKQAKPTHKIDGKDFEVLRMKKKETKESMGEYEGDIESEMKAEKLSSQEPTYVGKGLADNKIGAAIKNKIFGSFSDDHGWYDEHDNDFEGEFDFDYDEEEFDDFTSMYDKYGKQTKWFSPGERGQRLFDIYREKYGPMKIRVMKDIEESETEEGNEFSGNRADAIEKGEDSFEVDGKTYPVTGSKEETNEAKNNKKWIQKTDMKKGALHKKLGVPEGEKIPISKLKSMKKDLMKKGEGDKKLSNSQSKLLKQVNLALTLKDIKESKNILRLNENELIDLIERIVTEEQKSNIKDQEALGLKKTKKALSASKKENEQNQKEVTEKMKKYTKDTTKKTFEMNPESFPESNYTIDDMKDKTMKYHPSQAVDEYIEAFAYPGMTNLVFDEIKPDDKKIEKYLKGDSTTGNAVTDGDGKALGNVVPSKAGDRFMKNYEENLYGAEQMNGSYKRQPQPVDVNGSEKMAGSLKSIRKGSTAKAGKIMNQLESVEKKDSKKINEDIEKMKSLIGYNSKTQ